MQKVPRACSGQGSGSKGGLIDLQTCHHTEVKFRCGFWKWPKTPEKLEWNAYKNFVPSSLSGIPSDSSVQKSVQESVQKSVQKIRPKNPSKKSIQKIRPKICVICNCDCPDWCCQCQTNVEDIASSLNTFMKLHEGCLQVYICSREGQIKTKK